MKYWLLTTEYPPFFGGGIGTYNAVTSVMLSEQGHHVSVFINDASASDIRVERRTDSLRIIRFNPSRTNSSRFLGHVTNISYEFAHILKHFIDTEGSPDVIESQEYLGIAYYLLQYKYLLYDWCKDVPVVITMHSPSFLYMEYNHVPEFKYPNYWICEMERYCMQAADLLISPSRFMLDELKKRFQLMNENIAVIPNPFFTKDFSELRPSGAHNGEIVFYGKLSVQKGAMHLLKYFKDLWDNGFARTLYLIGGQDIVYHAEKRTMGDVVRKQYGKYIDQGVLKLEKKIEPRDLPDRLANAEVVIIPSANDNLPYVVLEMMALGKIVLISKQGGQHEVVDDGIDGFVFDHEQPETFAQQLNRILNLSPQERTSVSNNAIQKIVSRYDAKIIYPQKVGRLTELLKEPWSTSRFPLIRNHGPAEISPTRLKSQPDLLSIVVTFYNSGLYIDDAVDCLRQIDYPHKEIIIVNDGSNEAGSLHKLEQYRKTPGIKVIDKKNRGLPDTRNKGSETAEGEFLTFLDADDKIDPEYYSRAIKVLRHYDNVYFVGCWTKYFEGSQHTWPTFNPEPPLVLYHNLVNSGALVFRREAFFSAGKNDEHMTFQGFEDYDTVISAVEKGLNGVVIPEKLFFYRVRSNSMIRGISTVKKLAIVQYISNKHKEFYGKFAAEIFNLSTANGPGVYLDNPSLDHDLSDKIRFGGRFTGKIISLVKRNRLARTIAYKIYRLLNR